MMLDRNDFHGYQNDMVEFIKTHPSAGVFAEMGLGKTAVALTATRDLIDELEVFKVLVIAPLRVAKHTWTDEIISWAHLAGLSTTVLAGLTPKARAKAIHEDTDIHVINREQVVWLVEQLGNKWHYDFVILDESHSFKSPTSKRFKALKKVRPKIDRVLALTGTPNSKGMLNLWSQIFLLDRGERLGKTYSSFRNRYFKPDYMGYNWTLIKGADNTIRGKISDICISLKAEDYLQLPDKVINHVKVELPKKAMDAYKELEKNLLLEIEDETVVAVNAAVLSTKLRQAANGALYIDEDKNFSVLHDVKLEALEEIIEGAEGEPVLVVYEFQSDLARIMAKFPNAEAFDGDDTLTRWNRKEIPILLIHASSSTGLNMQKGGHIMAWFAPTWSLENLLQMIARLHRQGQPKPVIVHIIVAEGTVDELILKVNERDDLTHQETLNYLKHHLNRRTQ